MMKISPVPLYMAFFLPPLIFSILFINLLIISAVIVVTFKVNKIKLGVRQVGIFILKSYLFGFITNFLGMILLIVINDVYGTIVDTELWIRFSATRLYLLAIILIGILIFWFNLWQSKRVKLPRSTAIKIATVMGVLTAPWMFLIPTRCYDKVLFDQTHWLYHFLN